LNSDDGRPVAEAALSHIDAAPEVWVDGFRDLNKAGYHEVTRILSGVVLGAMRLSMASRLQETLPGRQRPLLTGALDFRPI
jgi:hypothetical protein